MTLSAFFSTKAASSLLRQQWQLLALDQGKHSGGSSWNSPRKLSWVHHRWVCISGVERARQEQVPLPASCHRSQAPQQQPRQNGERSKGYSKSCWARSQKYWSKFSFSHLNCSFLTVNICPPHSFRRMLVRRLTWSSWWANAVTSKEETHWSKEEIQAF